MTGRKREGERDGEAGKVSPSRRQHTGLEEELALFRLRCRWRWRCIKPRWTHSSPHDAHLHAGIHHLCWHRATPPTDENQSPPTPPSPHTVFFWRDLSVRSFSCSRGHAWLHIHACSRKNILLCCNSYGAMIGGLPNNLSLMSPLEELLFSFRSRFPGQQTLMVMDVSLQVERGHAVWLFNNQRKEGLQQSFRRDGQI